MIENRRHLSINDIARICKVSRATVNRWISSGLLNAAELPGSGQRRIHIDILREFAAENPELGIEVLFGQSTMLPSTVRVVGPGGVVDAVQRSLPAVDVIPNGLGVNDSKMAEIPKEAWSTAKTMATLRAKFEPPAFAFLTEVGDATGFEKRRSADALAMSCWPSRGLNLYGFEIKVSRVDWVAERKNPAKAEAICRYCDFWYVVAGSRGIVRNGELPPTWGLMEPKGESLVVTREAPKLEAVPWSRPFLAAILRCAAEDTGNRVVFEEEKRRAVFEAVANAKDQFERDRKSEVARMTKELETIMATVKTFEEASGLHLDQWDHGRKLAEAIRFVLDGRVQAAQQGMDAVERHARDVLRTIERYRAVVSGMDGGSVP